MTNKNKQAVFSPHQSVRRAYARQDHRGLRRHCSRGRPNDRGCREHLQLRRVRHLHHWHHTLQLQRIHQLSWSLQQVQSVHSRFVLRIRRDVGHEQGGARLLYQFLDWHLWQSRFSWCPQRWVCSWVGCSCVNLRDGKAPSLKKPLRRSSERLGF